MDMTATRLMMPKNALRNINGDHMYSVKQPTDF